MANTPKPVRKQNAKDGGDYKGYTKASKEAVKQTRSTSDAMTVKSKTGATRPYSKQTTGSTKSVPVKKKGK